MLSIRNDIASIIQYDNKIVITPHNSTIKRAEFEEHELIAMLALYSSYMREKGADQDERKTMQGL